MDIQEIITNWKEYILLIGAIIGAFLLPFVLYRILKVFLGEHKKEEYELLKKLKKPITFLLMLLVAYILLETKYSDLFDNSNKFFKISFILGFSWLCIRIVSAAGGLLMLHYDMGKSDNLKARKVYTQVKVFQRIISVIIIIVGASLALMTFESVRSFGTSLLASAGIAGVILGFAAQKVLANLLAGFQLAITQPIRIEDVVIMDGEWGWIEEITLTYVVVRIWDKRRLVVPSTKFIETSFQNWTRKSADIMGTVFIYTDYKMPVEPIRNKLNMLLKESKLWDGKVNVLQVTDLKNGQMELRALMSAGDSPTAWDLRVSIREKLITFLQQEYPQFLPVTRMEVRSPNEEIAKAIAGHEKSGQSKDAEPGS